VNEVQPLIHALATDPRFDWGSIAARWHSILAEA
jgi:hypothetical protein